MARKKQEIEEMSIDEKPLLHEGHGKPVTRRDFLSAGLIGGTAYAIGPSLLGGLLGRSSEAHAAAVACAGGAVAGGTGIPFMCFDLAGGTSMAASNVIVTDQGGGYNFTNAGMRKFGLIPGDNGDDYRANPGLVDNQFGVPFHTRSQFRAGLLAAMSPTTIANTNGSVIAARSANDTGNNPHNPMYGIYQMGNRGQLTNLIGSRDSDSGGRSRAPDDLVDLTQRPTKVSRARDARGVADPGRLGDILVNATDRQDLVRVIERMSHRKADILNEAAAIQTLLHQGTVCGTAQASDTVTSVSPDALDPGQDAVIGAQITALAGMGIGVTDDAHTSLNGRREGFLSKTAAAMKLTVNGFAGAATVEQGGYDYHNGTRTTGDSRDFDAGLSVGLALEYAARSNNGNGTPMMIYVFSDGSVAGDRNGEEDGAGIVWRGDNGGTAAVLMMVYNPAGRVATVNNNQQIGYYRDSASVETGANRVANSVDSLAHAIVLNYMALHNMQGQFNAIFGNNVLGQGAELDNYIAFANIRNGLN